MSPGSFSPEPALLTTMINCLKKYLSTSLCDRWYARFGATYVNKQRHPVLVKFAIQWKRQLINIPSHKTIYRFKLGYLLRRKIIG